MRNLHLYTILSIALAANVALAHGPGKKDTTQTWDLSHITLPNDPVIAQLDSLLQQQFFALSHTGQVQLMDSMALAAEPITFSDTVYRKALQKLDRQTPMNLQYHALVEDFIHLYVVRRREQVSRMLSLAQYYFPLFEERLDRYNMPLELKYLAVVESALNPNAQSHAGAHGLWQFIYSTAKLNDLEITSYYDERHDPIASTEAACKYLTQLYSIFGDWNLALAAYNSGPGNVNKAIRYSGGKRDYWSIRPFLPRETRSYVPAFIAVSYVFNHAAEHGIYPATLKPSYFSTDTLQVKAKLSLEQLSALLDEERSTLRFLNPAYRYEVLPGTPREPVTLVLPKNKVGLFAANRDSIYALAEADFERSQKTLPSYVNYEDASYHRVQRGEVLGLIAERYGVRASDLRRWNGIRGNMIRVGQRLKVYPRKVNTQVRTRPSAASGSASANTTAGESSIGGGTANASGKFQNYRVRSGESFYTIARKYPGVSAQNIMKWNNYKSARSLKPGAQLKIFPQGS